MHAVASFLILIVATVVVVSLGALVASLWAEYAQGRKRLRERFRDAGREPRALWGVPVRVWLLMLFMVAGAAAIFAMTERTVTAAENEHPWLGSALHRVPGRSSPA